MKTLEGRYNLSDFVKEMTGIVAVEQDEMALVSKAEHLVGKLVQDGSWFPFDEISPDQSKYARHSLYLDPKNRFEVLALVWAPGQATPLHDHDGTWGVEGVLSGRLKVINYLQTGKVSDDVVNLRYSGCMTVGEQSTGQLLPPADCHILKAEDNQSAITIHVYGKQLNKFKVFEALGQEGLYKTYDHEVSYTS
ncbi:Cysteine dioxygenase [Scopulibacillus darangshiensis]|uniref:Cysteine dioxygenase n=1 Tax=Scopulibacillus darangshiensis TaxID=442528 RepID=A0A4R2NDK8_9BACL|nr:cysteine dioxygenase family protein [Scopulibacillus darangshiensis]TCP19155.1 Cysteine dioxygenase [Scopulibacillus darangshiensis]